MTMNTTTMPAKRNLPILFICLMLAVCLLTACGETQKAVDLGDLRKSMLKAASLPEMLSVNSDDADAERNLTALTDISYDKVDAYFIDYAADGKAYEIAVIRVKDEKDAARVESDLKAHIASRAEQYRYYMPDQVANAENAVTAVQGSDIALIMCDDPSSVKAAFDAAFSG